MSSADGRSDPPPPPPPARAGSAPPPSDDDRRREAASTRPTPVRQGLDAAAEAEKAEKPIVAFDHHGDTWWMRVAGATAVGPVGGGSAHLALVVFGREGEEHPECEALVPRAAAVDPSDDELGSWLEVAGPFKGAGAPREKRREGRGRGPEQ